MRGLRLAILLVGLGVLSWARVAEANIAASGNINFGPVHNGVTAPTQTVNITSDVSGGPGDVAVTITESCPSVSVSPSSGTVPRMGNGPLVLTVTFTAPAGTRGAIPQCTINVTGPPSTSFTVDGEATAAQMTSAQASPVAFGNVRWNGTATSVVNFVVTNTGNESFDISNINAQTFGNAMYSVTNRTGFPAAPGDSATFELTFAPTANGAQNTTMTLSLDNDLTGESINRNLTGTGTQSFLTFSPASPVNVGTALVGANVEQTLTLQNLTANGATEPLNITSMAITGTNASDFSFRDHGCAGAQTCNPPTNTNPTIATNATDPYVIRCTPSAFGTRTATLTVVSDDPTSGGATSSKAVTLNCTSPQPALGVSPASPMTFAAQRVGTSSGVQPITISNGTGANPLTYTVTGGNAEFTLTCPVAGCLSGTLAGNTNAVINVTFTPSTTGPRTTSLTITTNDPDVGDMVRTYVINGTGVVSTLSTPLTLAFGNVDVSTAGGSTQNLTLTNTGGATLNISRLQIIGDAGNNFTFAFANCPAGAQDCPSPTIPPIAASGGTAPITLRCDPTTTGAKSGTLRISSDDPASPRDVALSCNGTTPDITVSPTTLADFGSQRVGTTSPTTRPFTINNPTGATAATASYTVSESSPDFSITCSTPGCTGSLAPGATQITVTVSFRPTVTGPISSMVTVTSSDLTEPTIQVLVSGTGVEPRITLDAPVPTSPPTVGGSLTFPTTNVGSSSPTQNIRITNSGTQTLTISAVNNTNPADFDVSAPASTTVAPGSSQMWTVTCSPDTQGTRTGTITLVNDSANDTAVAIALSCPAIQGRIAITSATPVVYTSGNNTIDFGPVIIGQSRVTTVTITNGGNVPVTLSPITFAPAAQGFTAGTPSSPTVAAGGSVTFTVTFTPTLNTQGTATLSLPSDWNTVAFTVTGDGQDTGLSVSPAIHDFGNVRFDVGQPGAPAVPSQVIRIANNGQAPAPLTMIRINPPSARFALTGVPGTLPTLGPSGQPNDHLDVTITVVPSPTTLGPYSATLEVQSSLPPPDDLKTSMLSYTEVGPGVMVTPGTTVNFDGVDVDLAGGRIITLTIANTAPASAAPSPLVIDSVTAITGTGAAAFSKSVFLGDIANASSANIMITYDPSTERSMATPEQATFTIHTRGNFMGTMSQSPDIVVNLSGWGIDRHLAVKGDGDMPKLDFGPVYRNPSDTDPRATKTLHVCNTGEAVLDITMITEPGAPFDVTSAPSFTVAGRPAAGGETCVDTTVTFHPDSDSQSYSGTLMVMNNDNSNPAPMATVELTGRGVARPVLITPDVPPERARIAVGVPVRLTEIIAGGIVAMNPDADETFRIRLELDDPAAVASVVGSVPGTIGPGVTENFDLEFVAKQAGELTVTVNVFLDDDPVAHDTISIALTGVEVKVGGGVGCSAGAGKTSWLLLALAALGLTTVRRRRRTLASAAAALLVGAAVLTAATPAQAQVSREIEVGTFHVTPATETALFTVETPQIAMKGAWALGLSVTHAVSILTADDGAMTTALVKGRTQFELGFGYAVLDRLELAARMPVMLQSGETSDIHGLRPAESNAIGDAAIAAKFSLVNKPKVGLALSVEGTIPTGKDGQFAGARTATGAGRLVLGVAAGKRANLALNAGFLGRGTAEFSNLKQGNAAVFGAGLSFRALEKMWLVGEVFGETGLASGADAAARPIETALGLRYRVAQSVSVSAGGGLGIMNGVGAAKARGFFLLTVSPKAHKDVELHPYIPPPPRDVGDDDSDGVVNADDACKQDAEDKDGFEDADGCPDADNDADGLLDANDKCPDQPEDKDGFEDGDGCIDTDNDADGVPDVDDKCPAEPEDKDGFEDGDGCEEVDNDKDGVPDVLDQCAMEAETINGNADEDGCPDAGDSMVMVMPDRIEVLEPITFQGVTTKLNKNAAHVLAQIGATMRADRKIKRVRITVHVQPRNGGDQELSDKRATEIRNWLVNWGVEPERLDAKGIGSKRPLVPKNQKGAAEINDRVEFIIFERAQ